VNSNGINFTVVTAPSITSLSPTTAAIGASVTITGTNFGSTQGTGTVTFNNIAATINNWSATSIVTTVPTGATNGNVVVNTSGVISNGVNFTVVAAPNITSLSPSSGAIGTSVTIAGTNFGSTQGNGTVTFNNIAATITSWTATSIVAAVPTGTTTGNVVVNASGVNSNTANFTVLNPPTIMSLSPTTGAAGTSVTIVGTNFGATQSNSTVTFNGTSAIPASWSASSIVVPVPTATTSGNVVVTVSGLTSNGVSFTVLPTPVISNLTPTAGQAGTSVTIAGINFGSAQGQSTVEFNGTVATPTSWTANSIVVAVPAGATSGPIAITVGSQTGYSPFFTLGTLPTGWSDTDVGAVQTAGNSSYTNGTFTVNGTGNQFSGSADSFHFVYQPLAGDGSIVARIGVQQGSSAQAGLMIRETFNPESTNADTLVSLPYGLLLQFNLREITGGSTSQPGYAGLISSQYYWVKLTRAGSTFSSYSSPDGVNWTQLGPSQTISMASNAYAGLVVESGSGGSLVTATFDNVSVSSAATPTPVITSVSATTGSVGSPVTINGTGFGASQAGSVVTLNAVPLTINSWSNTSIGVTIPAGAASGYMVVSVAPSMNDSNPILFTVTSQPLPSGWLDGDIGNVGLGGSATYTNQVFTVNAAGLGIQNGSTTDGFHFVYQPLSGDGSIVARVVSVPTGGAQAGVMIRETLDTAATNASMWMQVPYGSEVQFSLRSTPEASTSQAGSAVVSAPPYWVELVRSGNDFTSYTSPDGVNWTQVGPTQTINMAANAYVGLVADSTGTGTMSTATFDNVSVTSTGTSAPVITAVSATTGSVGSQVTISGTGFGSAQNGSIVTLNSAPVTINSWSGTSISITIPAGASSGNLVVSVAPSMDDSNPIVFTVTSQPLPSGWLDADVGAVGLVGSATYTNGTFTATASGLGIQYTSTADAFHFVYQPLSGNGSIVARIVSIPTGGAQAGVMIRETLNAGATNAGTLMQVPYASEVQFVSRPTPGAGTSQSGSAAVSAPPYWVELVRNGNNFSSYASPDGVNWTQVGTMQTINMDANAYVGLVAGSDGTATLSTATFDNVSVSFGAQSSAPSITWVSPGVAVPGASVLIEGTNFGSTQGASTLSFNGAAASPTSWSPTSIEVPVPLNATSGNIVATVNGLATNGVPFSVSQTPLINSLSPIAGAVGTSVTISGVNFGSSQGSSSVTFNGITTTPTSWNSTSIVAPVPAGSTSGSVTVTVNSVASSGMPFTVYQTPNITSLSAASATIGSYITITGTNFGPVQGTSTVTFNNVAGAAAIWSTSSVLIPVPEAATSGNVVVTVSGLSSNSVPITISSVALPAVAQVQPANGATGIPENGRVIVRFTQPISSSAVIPGLITVTQSTTSLSGNLALSADGLSVTFTPAPELAPNSTFSVAVTDLAGNQTTPEFQSNFTTGSTTDTTAPQIVQTSPQNGNTGVPISAPVVMQFSKPIDPATLTSQTFSLIDNVTGSTIPGALQVDPTGITASFIPQAFLGVDRAFSVSVARAIEDSSGNSLAGSSGFGFTTGLAPDTTAPQILGSSPSNATTNVPLNALIVLEFSKPLDVISVSNGLQFLAGGQPVQGGVALSNSNQQITFTPLSGLAPNTTYSIVTTSAITDVGGLALANPTALSFVTGSSTDTTTPSVTTVSPSNNATGIPTNGVVQLQFSKPIDPLTITGMTFQVSPYGALPIAGTISMSANGQTATFSPSSPLEVTTQYIVTTSGGITDMEGHALSGFESLFTTSFGTDATAPTVTMVSPDNGQAGVPVNVRVNAVFSAPLSAASIGSNAITVSAAGTQIAGAISLSSSGTTLGFVPTNPLAASTAYTVAISGVTDQAGNVVVPFASSFTTGASGTVNTTQPSVVSISPANGASAVSVNSTVVLTFNEPIDLTTVNDTTVQIESSGSSGVLAGSYSLDASGTVLTFTPLSPLPGNKTISVYVPGGVLDLSGNQNSYFYSTFTTGTGTNTTAPTVVSVTPQNGATGIGKNGVVVLTFSESLNASTINANNFGLFVNGTALGLGISVSADNRVVTLNPYSLPASSTVSVLVTSAVTDLFGNALANFESQFTTAPAFNPTVPTVVSQRPGNGATGVPLNASIVLYLSQPMNAGTVAGALHVAQNGVLVNGTTQVTDNGQVVQFLPSASWQANQQVQLFLDSTAQSAAGVNLNNYQSSFTTVPNASTVAPTQTGSNPTSSAPSVPTNVVIDMAFNEPVDPTTLTPDTLLCYQGQSWFQSDVTVVDAGTVVQVAPRSTLSPNTSISCQLSASLQGTNGLPSLGRSVAFTTSSGPDTVVPTIVTLSPPIGATNVGDNANVRLVFSKPINPLTVNATTIQLSGGGTSVVPDSISFSNNNQMALLVPHAPLPDNTLMTLTISGITDVAGNPVTPQTTQFTTGTGPDVVAPLVVWTSPLETTSYQSPTNVPLNAIVQLETNEPVDPGTVNSNTFIVSDMSTEQNLTGTYSVSADGLTITFIPGAPLIAGHQYSVGFISLGITDLAGNLLSSTVSGVAGNFSFITGTSASTNAPQVTGFSPANGATAIPINARAAIEFNEPIDVAKLTGVALTGPGGAVTVSQIVSNGNQTVTLVPLSSLPANTMYTVNVAGVQDMSGNLLASPVTSTFTTGSSADLTPPTVVAESPNNYATGVPTSAEVQLQFSKPINPLTLTSANFQVYPYTSVPMSGTIAVSTNGQTATFTPSAPLDSLTYYDVYLASAGITDMEGQTLTGNSEFFFTTAQATTAPPPNIATVSPPSGAVGTTVTIDGSYFGTTQGSNSVTFNGVPATATTWSDAQLVVSLPNGATTGPLVTTVNGVASNSTTYTVLETPTVTDISPASATVGTVVTINGTNFGDPQDSVYVVFASNVYPAPQVAPISWTPTSITVAVPSTTATGSVWVYVDGIRGIGPNFTLIPTPTISNLLPPSGVAGTPVYIEGSNFGSSQGSSTVSFNGVPAASVSGWSNNQVLAYPPSNVSTGPVTMVVNSIPSNSNFAFAVTNPAIGSLSPPSGAVGSTVTLAGSGLTVAGLTTQVFFNGVAASVASSSGNSLTVTVPTYATSGSVTVEVGSVSSNSLPFTVEQPPTITSVSPDQGPYSGLNATVVAITMSGSGFGATQSNSSVNFWGSNTPPTIQSWSDSSIVLYVPWDAVTGPLTVQVGGLTATAPSWFYVNQVVQIADSFGDVTLYSAAMQGGHWVTSASQGPGCSTCTVRGNITQVSDVNGNILSTTDDLNNATTFTYDSSNDLTSVSKPLNANTTATTSYTYNSFGEVLTMTDPLGNVTTNTYDAHGNLLTVTSPTPNGNTSASVTQFQYASNGELTQITDPLNNVTKLTYNSVGLIASITDAQNNVTSYQYDSRGNRTAVIDPINGTAHPTSFTYDAMSRLTGITYPDGSAVSFTYDVRGRRVTSTDQNNKTTTYTYDDADRLIAVTDPASNITQYAYDTEDNLLSITDANNHTTQFAYNARGWVTQTTFPSTLMESYTYDLVGNLLSKTDRKNQTIQYVYDALYRLTSKTYPNQTSVEYAYDLAGKVQQVSDPTGTYGFSYDNMGRLIGTSTQYSYLSGFNFQNAYTYDAASNRKSLTAPDGSISTYGYDTLNRLYGLANSWAGSFGFSYDALSRRTQLTRPNGVNTNYSYDGLSHLLGVLHQAGNTTLDGASYSYDPAGNRTSKGNYLNGMTSNYTYDPLYELTQVTQGASTTETYSYDAVGNRLSSSGVPTYNYNSSNELTSNSSGSYTYDANGNTLSDASGRSFTWDFENRLTQVVNPGVGTTTFRYDPVGRRIQKSGPLGATNYLYDRMNDIEEVDNAVNVLSRYTFGGLDQPLSQVRSGTTSYYQGDAQGTVTSLSNPAGAESNTYTYDSFGKLTASTGSITNPFQYTGREFDSETGLFFNRARYLDPSSGRFLSEDPLQFDGGINFFRYVGNRPTKFTDAFGLQQQCDKKSCGIDQAPEYDVNGSAPGGTTFHWNAVFKNDSTHDPKCCEVRQLISWNMQQPPHQGFPSNDQPKNWYEDRDQNNKRYGRRSGSYSDLQPGFDWYSGNGYSGNDTPDGFPAGDILRFRLIVVDVCNGGNTIYTSKTININF
jgi:RHS repeat-associated protein